jgi:hypothetical protein
MNNLNIPIACGLNDAEFRERREKVVRNLEKSVIEIEELDEGYTFSFPSTDETLTELIDFIRVEKICCPFLNFKMTLKAGEANVRLELTGTEGTKTFLASLFQTV